MLLAIAKQFNSIFIVNWKIDNAQKLIPNNLIPIFWLKQRQNRAHFLAVLSLIDCIVELKLKLILKTNLYRIENLIF